MKKLAVLFLLYIWAAYTGKAQTNEVAMNIKESGIIRLDCKVNGVPMWFIFDSGASICQISLTEALFLLKSGRLSLNDRMENVEMTIANGSSYIGQKFNIARIEIGNRVFENTEVVVVPDNYAPLLLGQNILKQHDGIYIDYLKNVVVFYPNQSGREVTVKKNGKQRSSVVGDLVTHQLNVALRELDSIRNENTSLKRNYSVLKSNMQTTTDKLKLTEVNYGRLMTKNYNLQNLITSSAYSLLPSDHFTLKGSKFVSGTNFSGSVNYLPIEEGSSFIAPKGRYKISKEKVGRTHYRLIYFIRDNKIGYVH